MRLKQTGWMLLGVLLLAPVTLAQQATQTRPQLTLEDIHASRTFIPEFFQGGRWAEEGPVILYIEPDPQTGATHLIRYNLETGRRERLIDGNRLYAHDVGRLIRIEDYQYSRDGRRVLLYTDSERVWRYNTKGFYMSTTWRPIRCGPLATAARATRCSPSSVRTVARRPLCATVTCIWSISKAIRRSR